MAALSCAAELGIADALADGPLSVDEIANRTGVQRGNLFRLLRALESIGIFRETSPGVFENNPSAIVSARFSRIALATGSHVGTGMGLLGRTCRHGGNDPRRQDHLV